MTLSEWMESKKLSQSQAGAILGVRSGTICRWLNGQRRPSVDQVLDIEDRTKGAVPASSWRKKPSAPRAPARTASRRGGRRSARHARSVNQTASTV